VGQPRSRELTVVSREWEEKIKNSKEVVPAYGGQVES